VAPEAETDNQSVNRLLDGLMCFGAAFLLAGLGAIAWALAVRSSDEPQWVIVGATLCYVGVTTWLALTSFAAARATTLMVAEMQQDREKRYEATIQWHPIVTKNADHLLLHVRNLSATSIHDLSCRAWRMGESGPIAERYWSPPQGAAPYEPLQIRLLPVLDDKFLPLAADMEHANAALGVCREQGDQLYPHSLLVSLVFKDGLSRPCARAFAVFEYPAPATGAGAG